MDFQNNSGFNFPQQPQQNTSQQSVGQFGQSANQQAFGQFEQQAFPQADMPVAPGFNQVSQEIQQGYSQPLDMGVSQPMAPSSWGQPTDNNSDQFGGDSFGIDSAGVTNPFGATQGLMQEDEYEEGQKWWQKGARVILLGGMGIFLLVIVIFIIATNVNKRKATNTDKVPTTQTSEVDTKPVEQLPKEQPVTDVQQPVEHIPEEQLNVEPQPQSPVQDTTVNGWQLIGNTDDFTFVGTKAAEFIVQSKGTLYYRQKNEGMQVRNVATGTIVGYDGLYEVDIPRSAVLYGEVIKGYRFNIKFDVYTSADGNIVFLENLRPDK